MAMKLIFQLFNLVSPCLKKYFKYIALAFLLSITVTFISGKIYQGWDNREDRGAIAMPDGAYGESFSTPVYLDQGWSPSDSLWFYNTTQGSALLPYDFYLSLEQADSTELFRSNQNIDKYRYLPQRSSFFNPDALSVGFVKETYKGKDYMGYTCAACHTAQVNYQGKAIRIDGGPAMADMVGFLTSMQKAMEQTLAEDDKRKRFIDNVKARKNDYKRASDEEIIADLQKWIQVRELYNIINHSKVDYGHARLDAFGRIYNRVLQYVLNKQDVADILTSLTKNNRRLLTDEQITLVLKGVDETVLNDGDFTDILDRLQSSDPGYPALSAMDLFRVRNAIFNEPDAPVSYPFLWDIAQSDYVQWNAVASNAGLGPLGRNTGEVIGVFGILDWTADDSGFSFSSWLTGQSNKRKHIDFTSSINLVNLQRLEAHLKSLQSPVWPESILGTIDKEKARRGKEIYASYCQGCHEVVDRSNLDRRIIAHMSGLKQVGTDPAMAENSVYYSGKSGNFAHTYQDLDVGTVLITETAPVVQILTSATKGVVGTPDPDKWLIRRIADWFYTLGMSFFNNDIKASIKNGNYEPDTTARPYQSLLAYKGRSLNGIWATAPYLHNGSVPTLYDLLLPAKREGDPEEGEYRPDRFFVGSREFDPVKVGFSTENNDGFEFESGVRGNMNTGHEYAAGRTAQSDGTTLPALTREQRWDLVEYLKTL